MIAEEVFSVPIPKSFVLDIYLESTGRRFLYFFWSTVMLQDNMKAPVDLVFGRPLNSMNYVKHSFRKHIYIDNNFFVLKN